MSNLRVAIYQALVRRFSRLRCIAFKFSKNSLNNRVPFSLQTVSISDNNFVIVSFNIWDTISAKKVRRKQRTYFAYWGSSNLNASPQSYAVSKKSIVPTTFTFVRKYVLHFAKYKCAFGGKFYEKRFDTTCIKPSFWCWRWDLNPHVVTNIGFWVRRVCHSTTPAG